MATTKVNIVDSNKKENKMNKKTKSKKKRIINKIILAVVAILVVAVLAGSAYWFSMPSEQRNMLTFMMFGGENCDNYQEYQVIGRNDKPLTPTSFEPTATISNENVKNVNIASVTEKLKNEDSTMLKKGNVQTMGIDEYYGWYALADEGAAGGSYPFGPSPLSYYTAGLASNLHTQIIKAAEIKEVAIDNVKVEIINTFRWDDMMSAEGAGFLDLSKVSIMIESSASEDVIQEVKESALNSWAAGEALRNETEIIASLVSNGDDWENYRSTEGTSTSDESYDGENKLSQITDVVKKLETLEVSGKEDEEMSLNFDVMSNMQFEIYAISESANNIERPYLKIVTVSTPSEETWEIYSDEFMGENDTPLAPTSLEYFTMGTSLCLTSQTTLVSAIMGLDYTDYRVENQIDYHMENIDSIDMQSYTDTVYSYIVIESVESEERLEKFFNKSLSLCFAGEGLKNATDMDIKIYLNGNKLE